MSLKTSLMAVVSMMVLMSTTVIINEKNEYHYVMEYLSGDENQVHDIAHTEVSKLLRKDEMKQQALDLKQEITPNL